MQGFRSFSVCNVDLCVLHAEVLSHGMALKEDIDVVALDTAAFILSYVNFAVDEPPVSGMTRGSVAMVWFGCAVLPELVIRPQPSEHS